MIVKVCFLSINLYKYSYYISATVIIYCNSHPYEIEDPSEFGGIPGILVQCCLSNSRWYVSCESLRYCLHNPMLTLNKKKPVSIAKPQKVPSKPNICAFIYMYIHVCVYMDMYKFMCIYIYMLPQKQYIYNIYIYVHIRLLAQDIFSNASNVSIVGDEPSTTKTAVQLDAGSSKAIGPR